MIERWTQAFILVALPCVVHGRFEFGRSDPSPRKHLWQRKRNIDLENVGSAEWRKNLNRLEKTEIVNQLFKQ